MSIMKLISNKDIWIRTILSFQKIFCFLIQRKNILQKVEVSYCNSSRTGKHLPSWTWKFRTKWAQKIKVGISLHSVLELCYFWFLYSMFLSWMVVHRIIVSLVSRASLPFCNALFFSFLRGSGNGIEKMRNPLWQYAI